MKGRTKRTINNNTSAFIEAAVNEINNILPCYFDRAPTTAEYPYSVLSGITASDLAAGDLTMFDVDIWTDDKLPTATEDIESLCDELRNYLHKKIIMREGVFLCHIGYESRDTTDDKETDITHRRLIFAARIFYI